MLELLPPGTLEGFGLVLSRTGALLLAAPILGEGLNFSGIKVGLVMGVSLAMYPVVAEPLPEHLPGFVYAAMMLREVLIGVFLAFTLHLVTLVVKVAGHMIGQEMGLMIARQIDPITGQQTPLISSVYETFFLLALLSMNGHHWLIRALGMSFERAPIGSLELSDGLGPAFQALFSEMFRAGIVFGAPIMVLLTLASIMMGLLSRVVSQLNVMEVGFSVRLFIGLGAMALFAPLLEPSLEGLQRGFISWLERAVDALGV